MAPLEGRREADGLLLFQRRAEEHHLPALRPLVRRRLPELLLLRLCPGGGAGQVAGHRPGDRLQPDPAHPVCHDRHGRFLAGLEPAWRRTPENGWGKKLQYLDRSGGGAGHGGAGQPGHRAHDLPGLPAPGRAGRGDRRRLASYASRSGRCAARCGLSPARRCPTAWAIGIGSPAAPSRSPGDVEPITEFPFFTTLYADPHAHFFALPVTLAGARLCPIGGAGARPLEGLAGGGLRFAAGRAGIGALRPTNTWDIYTYLPLGIVAVAYTFLVYYEPGERGLSCLARSFEKHARRSWWRLLPCLAWRCSRSCSTSRLPAGTPRLTPR